MTTPSPAPAPPPPISPGEAAAICANYDLGAVRAVHALARGSSSSARSLIQTDSGAFLLKRRAPGRDHPEAVALSHRALLFLAERAFPVPRLIGTKRDHNSILRTPAGTYELFAFVPGEPSTPGDPLAAGAAGHMLGRLHRALADFRAPWSQPAAQFHNRLELMQSLMQQAVRSETLAAASAHGLASRYARAAMHAEKSLAKVSDQGWIHGDWHPGNLVFAPGSPPTVAAVLDFESLGLGRRILDLATGVVQFLVVRTAVTPTGELSEVEVGSILDFISQYESGLETRLSPHQSLAAPWLMIESLCIELAWLTAGAPPDAAPGSLARVARLVAARIDWIESHAATLSRRIAERAR